MPSLRDSWFEGYGPPTTEVVGYYLPSLRDSWFEGYGLPTTEVVGYYLPSLPGLNSHSGLTHVFFRPCRDSIRTRG